jgi:hypothetical protein
MRDTEHELHSVKGLILLTDMTVVWSCEDVGAIGGDGVDGRIVG